MQLIRISAAYCLLKFLASGQSLFNSTNSNNSYQLPEVCPCNCSNNYDNGQNIGLNTKLFETSPPTNNPSSHSTIPQECGRLFTNDSALYNFSHGEARIHWPWSAFVGREGLSIEKHVQFKQGYAGSIIGKKWILSSTFVYDHTPTKDVKNQTAGPMVSMYTVKNITVHPKYLIDSDASFAVNLIELDHEISFNQYVQPICISASSKLKNIFPARKMENTIFEQGNTLVTGYLRNANYASNDQYGFYHYSNKLWQWSMKIVKDYYINYGMPSAVKIYKNELNFQFLTGAQLVKQNASSGIWNQHGLIISDTKHFETTLLDLVQFCEWIYETTRREVACK
ncbi:trypsin domain-containing protein [Ditylenchus destructor]|nr:trypsin domain-containing protein [Ditylenchus destructor]